MLDWLDGGKAELLLEEGVVLLLLDSFFEGMGSGIIVFELLSEGMMLGFAGGLLGGKLGIMLE